MTSLATENDALSGSTEPSQLQTSRQYHCWSMSCGLSSESLNPALRTGMALGGNNRVDAMRQSSFVKSRGSAIILYFLIRVRAVRLS